MELEKELIKQLKGIRRELEKISKTLRKKERTNEESNYCACRYYDHVDGDCPHLPYRE